MTANEITIMEEYRIKKICDGYYRTNGGRAYIKQVGNGYTIYSCNGSYVTSAPNFRLACIRANIV